VAAVTLEEGLIQQDFRPESLLALDEALDRLATYSERQAKVVVMRFFGGLKEEEIAEVLGISGPTVRRDWRFAKAWLNKELAS
jgi:RNA polymerase sigma factor (sigma-70 family)